MVIRKHALRALFAAILAVAFVSSAFWLNGFNFDARGEPAGVWFVLSGLLSLAASIITYIVSRETSKP